MRIETKYSIGEIVDSDAGRGMVSNIHVFIDRMPNGFIKEYIGYKIQVPPPESIKEHILSEDNLEKVEGGEE